PPTGLRRGGRPSRRAPSLRVPLDLGGRGHQRRASDQQPVGGVGHRQRDEGGGQAQDGLLLRDRPQKGMRAKVLTVSDGVIAGTREDRSGAALAECLVAAGHEVVDRRVVADGVDSVARALRELTREFRGLVVTTGGTGFAPRDLTPEGTRAVLDREAPGLAEAIRLVSPKGRLSRGVAGTAGQSIVLNTPGSQARAAACLQAIPAL